MAAIYKIMHKTVEETVMLKANDFESFETLFDRLLSYSGTKQSLSMREAPPKTTGPGTETLEIGARRHWDQREPRQIAGPTL